LKIENFVTRLFTFIGKILSGKIRGQGLPKKSHYLFVCGEIPVGNRGGFFEFEIKKLQKASLV
jgi:hypothetical protein